MTVKTSNLTRANISEVHELQCELQKFPKNTLCERDILIPFWCSVNFEYKFIRMLLEVLIKWIISKLVLLLQKWMNLCKTTYINAWKSCFPNVFVYWFVSVKCKLQRWRDLQKKNFLCSLENYVNVFLLLFQLNNQMQWNTQ